MQDEDVAPPSAFRRIRQRFGRVLLPLGILAGGSALFATVLATGPKPEKKDDAGKPPAVATAAVETAQQRISVTVQGEVAPRVEADLAAEVSGRVLWTSPNFAEGRTFAAGEALAKIDPADYALAVTQAQAQVAQAEEAMAREQAEADLARQDWAELGRGDPSPLVLREPQMAQARAARDAAAARLKTAELALERATVRAPFAGRVRTQRIEVGDYVGPGAPLGAVFATDVMEVRVPLTDADLAHLGVGLGFAAAGKVPGPKAELSATVAGKPARWSGTLVRTEAAIDPRTRLVYGFVEVRDPFSPAHASPLAPGLFVSVEIEGAAQEQLVAAPRAALKKNEFVYVVTAEGEIDIRTLEPAQTTPELVYFRGGLKAGEQVVTSHLPSPRQGMAVILIEPAAAAAAEKKS